MYTIRKATEKDFPAIKKLIWKVRINPQGLDWRRFLVAVDENDNVLGCGQIKPHDDGSHELASIAVQPAWQCKGIGRVIIRRLLEENDPPLYLMCRAALETYYQQFGFRTIGKEEMPPSFRRVAWLFAISRWILPKGRQGRIMKL